MARRTPLVGDPRARARTRTDWRGRTRYIATTIAAHRILVWLIGCYLAIGFSASLLMPPWQSPDEPAHFEFARSQRFNTTAELPEIQQPIIDTFYDFRFWQERGRPPPETPPEAFSQIPRLIIRQISKAPLYYDLAAVVSSWTNDTILQLYSMRWLSIVLSSLTIPLVYLTAREVLPPERRRMALVAAALVAFLPMYSYIGASVNPDTLGAPLAAAAVLLATRGMRRLNPAAALAGVVLAVLAFWVRRSAIALLPWTLLVALICVLVWLWRRQPRTTPRATILAASICSVVAMLAAILWPGDLASGWGRVGTPWGATISNQHAYEGRHSLRIARATDAPPAALVQPLTIPQMRYLAGRTITFEAVVRSDTPLNGQIGLQTIEAPVVLVDFQAGDEWQRVRFMYDIPTPVPDMYWMLVNHGTGQLFVDDLTLTADGVSTTVLRVGNESGEQSQFWWEQYVANRSATWQFLRILQAWRDGAYVSEDAFRLYPYFIRQLATSLVGRFGWMSLSLNQPVLHIVHAIVAVLLLCVVGAWRRTSGVEPGQRAALALLALLIVLAILALFLEYTSFFTQVTYPQGRYLFPVLGALATLLTSGLAQLTPRRFERVGILVSCGLMMALLVWSWAGVIVPHFYTLT
jgi:hypothetical protein